MYPNHFDRSKSVTKIKEENYHFSCSNRFSFASFLILYIFLHSVELACLLACKHAQTYIYIYIHLYKFIIGNNFSHL